MTPTTLAADAAQALQGVTEGRAVQFHPHYCKEAEGAPFSDWDTSHDVSVIRPDGSRYRIASFRHASDAAFDQFARAWVPEAAAALTALSEQNAKLAAQVAELRQSRQAMHRRAQKAEGKSQRSAFLLETILRSIKEVIPALPTLPSPYPLSLHDLYHRVRAARDHARASSGRAFIEGWYYWSPRVAELTRERDDALSAARQQDKLREAALATLRGVSADLDAAEAKVARLEGALTPSGETKAEYMGEFSIPFPIIDENGDEVMLRPNVPWTTIKEIMAAIRARATLTEGTPE
jgi:hypothetical protein